MQLFASYYWHQGGDNRTSLVLQQVFHKQEKMPVLLAAVGQEGTQGFAGELVDWFYGEGLFLCEKYGERRVDKIERHFRAVVNRGLWKEMIGIVCVGSHFVLFQRGGGAIRLLNTRHAHSCCQRMNLEKAERGIGIQTGKIQPGVSLVLATKAFTKTISDNMLANSLQIMRQKQEVQVKEELEVLGRIAEARGEKELGAIWIEAV